ncbi:MAG: hypothetical protein ACLT64_07725 [Streptococcus salivarius]
MTELDKISNFDNDYQNLLTRQLKVIEEVANQIQEYDDLEFNPAELL